MVTETWSTPEPLYSYVSDTCLAEFYLNRIANLSKTVAGRRAAGQRPRNKQLDNVSYHVTSRKQQRKNRAFCAIRADGCARNKAQKQRNVVFCAAHVEAVTADTNVCNTNL
jgi:hypothetical protein